MTTFYFICFLVSIGILVLYFLKWNRHFNRFFTIIELMIPLVCFGCWRLSLSTDLGEAIICNDIIYIGGCFLLPIVGLGIADLGQIKLPRPVSVAGIAISVIIYFSLITTEYTGLFYKTIQLSKNGDATILTKTYGIAHTVFYVVLIVYAVSCFIGLIYCLKKSRKTSRIQMVTLLLTIILCVISFFICQNLLGKMEPTFMYCIAQLGLILISLRSQYYFADDFVMFTISDEGGMGCMTFDMHGKVLGWNDVAEYWFPELKDLKADKRPPNETGINGKFYDWFDKVDQTEKPVIEIIPSRDKSIMVTVREVAFSKHRSGYCISMRDDTAQQQLMDIMQKNSEKLIEQVTTKNERLTTLSKTFEHYVDPTIMNEILKGADVSLSGREMNIVVMFADIRGFTTLSESTSPEETVHILNSTFELMAQCVMKNHGTLDKFIGDCIMAIWNAPIVQDDPAYLACRAAKDIMSGLPDLNSSLGFSAGNGISIGIGINSGPATVGNFGATKRMDYTAVGDTVNVASRLESIAPANTIYINQSVIEKLDERAKYTSIGKNIKLRGKNKELEIFTLDYLE